VRGPILTGFGKRPFLHPAHHALLLSDHVFIAFLRDCHIVGIVQFPGNSEQLQPMEIIEKDSKFRQSTQEAS
jgi:hypothetical protein